MKITKVNLRQLKMKMKFKFETSLSTVDEKEFILVEVVDDDGISGWGETLAFSTPFYTEETVKTNWHMLADFLIPQILGKEIGHPDELINLFSPIKRNNMAKAAIECATWDLYAKKNNVSLAKALGGTKQTIDVGVSIGIQKSIDSLLQIIDQHVDEGYKRIKIKISPNWDINVINAIRNKYPNLPLMADANSAYTLDDLHLLKQLDQFDLMMIEQPLDDNDIIDHAIVQSELKTPICLDESIHTYDDARLAIKLKSCQVINLKYGRVGGLSIAKQIHDLCRENNIAVWCGGMLEAGIGRAHSVAISTLDNFTMPGDTASSNRYWEHDIITPEVTVKNGQIKIPTKSGLGYDVDLEAVNFFTKFERSFRL